MRGEPAVELSKARTADSQERYVFSKRLADDSDLLNATRVPR